MLADMISTYKQGDILKRIDSPNDLKSLNNDELLSLAKQVREYILEVVSKNPLIVIDGAHNPDGASELGEALKNHSNVTAIIGVMKDKNGNTNVIGIPFI